MAHVWCMHQEDFLVSMREYQMLKVIFAIIMLSVSSLAYADKWEYAKLVQSSTFSYETDKVTYSWYFKGGSSPAVTGKNEAFKNKKASAEDADIVDIVNIIGSI